MEERSNGMSIAGFIVSLGSLFLGLWGLTGLVGVVLSAVGRSQAVNNGGKTALPPQESFWALSGGLLLDYDDHRSYLRILPNEISPQKGFGSRSGSKSFYNLAF